MMADIAHIAGLVATGQQHPSPFPHAHVSNNDDSQNPPLVPAAD